MASAGFSVTIKAVDAASGVIGKVNTGLAGLNRRVVSAFAPFERFGQEIQKLGDNTGVTRLAAGVTALSRRIAGAGESLGRFAPALAGITSVASIAGIASLVEHFTTFGSAVGFAAQRSGLAVDALHDMQGAARIAGSSAESLTSGMTALGDNLTNAVAGRSAQTVQMMAALGLSFTDAFGHARAASVVLPEVANRIAALRNPTQQAIVANGLFGAAGESLLPFLCRGAAGIEEYNLQAERYGLINEEGARSANEMRMAQTRLRMAVEGVGYSIADKIAPVLVPLLDRLPNWIADNRSGIGEFFRSIAEGFRAWIDSGGLDRLIAGFKAVAGWVIKVGVGIERLISTLLAIRLPSWMSRLLGIPVSVETTGAGSLSESPGGGWLQDHLPSWLGGHPSSSSNAPVEHSSANQEAFVANYGPMAQRVADQTGVSPRVILGQLWQETGGRGDRGNNPFNLQAGSGWTGQRVSRGDTHADGSRYTTDFRVYGSLNEAADDYARLIRTSYPGAIGAGDDARRFADGLTHGVGCRRYAEDPGYAEHVAGAASRFSGVPLAPAIAPVPIVGKGGAGGAGADGKVVVRVDLPNAPPGTRATTIANGQGLHVEQPTLGNTP